jgi:hypothetical protein
MPHSTYFWACHRMGPTGRAAESALPTLGPFSCTMASDSTEHIYHEIR